MDLLKKIYSILSIYRKQEIENNIYLNNLKYKNKNHWEKKIKES